MPWQLVTREMLVINLEFHGRSNQYGGYLSWTYYHEITRCRTCDYDMILQALGKANTSKTRSQSSTERKIGRVRYSRWLDVVIETATDSYVSCTAARINMHEYFATILLPES